MAITDRVIKHLLGRIAKKPIIIDLQPYEYHLYIYAREYVNDKTTRGSAKETAKKKT